MLVELLMAMFILALGLTAIAAIFPVASYLQKQTFNDAVGQQVARNVEAILPAIIPATSSPSGIGSGTHQSDKLVFDAPSLLASGGDLPLAVRCYPTALDMDRDGTYNEPLAQVTGYSTGDPEDNNFDAREFYWVPLFQDVDTSGSRQWAFYVFILAKQPNASYSPSGTVVNSSDDAAVPKVVEVPGSSFSASGFTIKFNDSLNLQPGDQLLGDNGMTMTVTDVSNDGKTVTVNSPVANTIGTPGKIWYAPPAIGGQNSPTVAIKVVS